MPPNFPEILENKTIMIIDDLSFYRDFIKQFLINSGHKGSILEATNNRDAIEKINGYYNDQKIISFIIADLHLPDGNSSILIEKIRKNEVLKNIPILLITTEDKRSLVLDSLKFGANDYCFKPINQDVILEKMNSICNLKT